MIDFSMMWAGCIDKLVLPAMISIGKHTNLLSYTLKFILPLGICHCDIHPHLE